MDFWNFYWFAVATLFGACVGSFYNVLLWRWPRGESVLRPPSTCPKCHQQLKWYDNVPVLAWLVWLGQKCRFCKNPIPARYPIVEALGGVAAGLPILFWGIGFWSFEMAILGSLVFLVVLPVIWMDFEHFLIPVSVVWLGVILTLIWILYFENVQLWDRVLGAVIGAGGLWLVGWVISKWKGVQALGSGDVDLVVFLGLLVSWKFLPIMFLMSALTALLAVFFWKWFPGLKPKCADPEVPDEAFPFGPFLCLGGLIAWLWGAPIADLYWQWVLPV